jgi:uncharacterized protein YukE
MCPPPIPNPFAHHPNPSPPCLPVMQRATCTIAQMPKNRHKYKDMNGGKAHEVQSCTSGTNVHTNAPSPSSPIIPSVPVDQAPTAISNTPIAIAPSSTIHTNPGEPVPSQTESLPAYDKPLVPAVASLKANSTLSNVDYQLAKMESDWRGTSAAPFPDTICQMFGQLRAAVEARDIETVQTTIPMWGVQVAEETDNKKEGDEEQRKQRVIDMVCNEARKADSDPTYGTAKSFDWAEDVDATPEPTQVARTPCTPRDFSALRSSTIRNPWASLNFRHRRSRPAHTKNYAHQPFYPSRNTMHYVQTPPTPPPQPSPIPIQVIETVRHLNGIAPAKPIIRTTSPVHHTTPFAPTTPPVVHPAPPTHPILIVQCHCGSALPIHWNPWISPRFGRRFTPSSWQPFYS